MNIHHLRLIVIAGCQRSGTTLTGQILGAHPDTFLIDEFDGAYPFIEAFTGRKTPSEEALDHIVRTLAEKYQDHRAGFSQLSDLEGCAVVLKAPNVTYDYRILAPLKDRLRIVFPVRDCRAVVASILNLTSVPMIRNQTRRLKEHTELSAEFSDVVRHLENPDVPDSHKAALIWSVKTGMYRRFSDAGLAPFVFRYEDLISEAESLIRAMLMHCGLSPQHDVMNYPDILKGMGPGNTSRQSAIQTLSLNKWKDRFTQEDEAEILKIAGDTITGIPEWARSSVTE